LKETFQRLVHRKRVCSAQAAAVSILLHVLLIAVAGSIVAVRYVQKRNAELNVVMREPKLERRQLQLPQKNERVRRTARRPKIITTRADASATAFSVPDLGDMGEQSTQKFDAPFARSSRDFRSLSSAIGVGAPQFKFLGVRAEGEKVIFVLDASELMLTAESGGKTACDYIKGQLDKVLEDLPSSVLFNVLLYDGETVAAFRPGMVPVIGQNRSELTEWIQPYLGGEAPGGLSAEQNTYVPEVRYETAVGDEAREWALALQAALEQRPDTVFVVGRSWGRHSISREKGKRLVDFTLWQLLSGSGLSSVGGSPVLMADRELRDSLIQQAVEAIQDEEELRRLGRDPAGFLRDLISYIQYSEDQIFDHLDAVVQSAYAAVNLPAPWVHSVRLVSETEDGVSDASASKMRALAGHYDGEFAFLNGPDSAKKMRVAATGQEADGAVEAEAEAPDEIPESKVAFFGMRAEGSRIAFVLDASDQMVDGAIGGTNLFAFLKGQLAGMAGTLSTGTLFNVILSAGENVAMFRPEMVPAEESGGLSEWLAGVSNGVPEELCNYAVSSVYGTAIGSDVQGIPLAVQAAMEQQADSILVIAGGLGRLQVGREKARRLLEFSIVDALGGGQGTSLEDEETEEGAEGVVAAVTGGAAGSKGGLLQPLEEDRAQRSELIAQALKRIEEEVGERERAGLPPGFVHDITDYIQYLPAQVLDHLATVAENHYLAEDGAILVPQIHFTVLMEPDERLSRDELRVFRQLVKTYAGEMKMLIRAETDDEIRKLNRMLDLYP
jgi:hypothetical protein